MPGPTLWNTSWVLTELDGEPVRDGATPTLDFLEHGRAAGHTGCNRYFGSVTLAGNRIEFGGIGSTRMACPEPVMTQEHLFLKSLAEATRFETDGQTLHIHTRATNSPLRFAQR